jgi:hypothetical protein
VVLADGPSRLPLLVAAGVTCLVLAGVSLALAARARAVRAAVSRRS